MPQQLQSSRASAVCGNHVPFGLPSKRRSDHLMLADTVIMGAVHELMCKGINITAIGNAVRHVRPDAAGQLCIVLPQAGYM